MTHSSWGDASNTVADLDPIVVTSPTIRSGTTLIQRLLCSSPDTLIYGEECAKDLEFSLTVAWHKIALYGQRAAQNRDTRQKVLRGQLNEWIVDLMPDLDRYLGSLHSAAFAGLAACHEDALAEGRPLWGFKYPGLSPQIVTHLLGQMPRLRLVYIARDLEGSLKSAKTWKEMHAERDVRAFCRQWAENTAFLEELRGNPAVLALDYREVTRDPGSVIDALARFTGASAIDAEVAAHRVNSPASYLPPAELTDTDRAIVAETLR